MMSEQDKVQGFYVGAAVEDKDLLERLPDVALIVDGEKILCKWVVHGTLPPDKVYAMATFTLMDYGSMTDFLFQKVWKVLVK